MGKRRSEIIAPSVVIPEAGIFRDDKPIVAEKLGAEASTLMDGAIRIWEMSINGMLRPDVALIEADVSTPVQRYTGEGEVTVLFYSSMNDSPVGVIVQSDDGSIRQHIWDPLHDGGPRGFTYTPGDVVQILVDEGNTLTFFDYWPTRGFMEPTEDGTPYGYTVIHEVEPDEEFIATRDDLLKSLRESSNLPR